MANEKRLIDANGRYTLHASDNTDYSLLFKNGIICVENELGHCVCEFFAEDAPTVDAVVLPCKIGDDVYIIPSKVNFDLNVLANHKENNRVYHQKVANIVFAEDGWYMTGSADMEYGTGRILLDRFYKETWFLTKKEAEAALAKMDRGNDNA